MTHPAMAPGRMAVVTGAASGIGLAACKRFAASGMKVALADVAADDLAVAREEVAALARGGFDDVVAITTDVADPNAVGSLADAVYARFGEVGLLMNNAATRVGGGVLASHDDWRRSIDVNLWGVINGVHAFLPATLEQATPCAIVNTGSKQGITNPPRAARCAGRARPPPRKIFPNPTA